MTSTAVVPFSRRVDLTLEDIEMSDVIQVTAPKWLIRLHESLSKELDRMEEMIKLADQEKKDMSNMFPTLVREYRTLIHHQQQLYDQAVSHEHRLTHMEKKAFVFFELMTQNFNQHVYSAFSIFENRTKEGFDSLRSTLEEQIASVYQLAEYAEKIRIGADETFLKHRIDIGNLRQRLEEAEERSVLADRQGSETMRDLRRSQQTLAQVQDTLHSALQTVDTQRRDFEQQQQSWRAGIERLVEELGARLPNEEDRHTLRDIVNSVTGEPQRRRAAEVAEDRSPSVAASRTSNLPVRTRLPSSPPDNRTAGASGGVPLRPLRLSGSPAGSGILPPPPPPPTPPKPTKEASGPSDGSDPSGSDTDHSEKSINYRDERRRRKTNRPDSDKRQRRYITDTDYETDRYRVKKNPMKAPPAFKGKPEEDFNRWMRKVTRYFRYHKIQYPTDQDRIDWLAGILEGDAQDWYEGRADLLERRHKKDKWSAFTSAMKERFTDVLLEEKYLDELHNQVYDGNIQAYLTKLDNLNAFVGLRGLQWQRAIKAGLPKWFKDHMALNTKTKFDDFEFKELVRSVGFRAETHKRQEQQERDRLKKYAEKYEKSKGKDKPKEKSTSDSKPSYEGKKENKGGNSQSKNKKESETKSSASKGDKDRSSDKPEKIHTDKEKALEGVPESVRNDRYKVRACQRCGKQGHWWYSCRGKITVSGVQDRKGKRKADSEPEEDDQPSKKTKTVSGVGRSLADRIAPARIYEVESEDEEL
jgi:hypothetical protein